MKKILGKTSSSFLTKVGVSISFGVSPARTTLSEFAMHSTQSPGDLAIRANLLAMCPRQKTLQQRKKDKLRVDIAVIYLLSKHVVYLARGTLILQEQACQYLSAIFKQKPFVFNCV